jgi:hypothetical protein
MTGVVRETGGLGLNSLQRSISGFWRVFPIHSGESAELLGNTRNRTWNGMDYDHGLGPYVAFSHCWGRNTHLKLTADTRRLFERIDIENLPANFRDAAQLTRRLGFRYVWIDSLCLYLDRSRIKCCRNLRLRPLLREVFDLAHLACWIGIFTLRVFYSGHVLIHRFLLFCNNAALALAYVFFVLV